jgi:hypothetical protein
MLPRFVSDKFRFWSFVSMACLVLVHAYDLDVRGLSPATLPNEPLTFTSFVEYFLANGVLRFRMPLLFAISGYLYAFNDRRPNGERVRQRFRTLIVPYLAWSGLCLIAFYAVETIPTVRQWIAASGVARIHGMHLLVHDYDWREVLIRWIVAPLPYQLWFIRELFFFDVAYPWLRRWLTSPPARRAFLAVAVPLWLGTVWLWVADGEGLLFFALGVWMQKSGFDIERPAGWARPGLWAPIFVGAALLKTWLAFDGVAWLGVATAPVIVALFKLTTVAGIIVVWFGGDGVVRWCMRRAWLAWLVPFSFFIYASHAPWVAIAVDPFAAWLGPVPGRRLLTFLLLPTVILTICVAGGAALRTLAPAAYGVLTGGRGFAAAQLPAPAVEVGYPAR